ncbi:MAG: TlyA family RNA methyltransferase [Actinomycetota bacterium]|nr:TlyA family RNA methyltransferase [Actinomycetota bacterium]
MTKRIRLDAELVRRGLASTRSEAKLAIEEGKVTVKGLAEPRPSSLVDPERAIQLTGAPRRFKSRGGDKLDAALEAFDVVVADRRWLDAGASTGGFTDRLLQGRAAAVIALDVGYGQLDLGLRNDPRVIVLERTNVRKIGAPDLPWRPDGVVADLSFISLAMVLPALVGVAARDADFVLLVKPQFEVGREDVGKGGVVREPASWRSAIESVVRAGRELGLGLAGACASPLVGPAGNRELFVHLKRGAAGSDDLVRSAVAEAAV